MLTVNTARWRLLADTAGTSCPRLPLSASCKKPSLIGAEFMNRRNISLILDHWKKIKTANRRDGKVYSATYR